MNKEKIKKEFINVAKLLWPFKWYILPYLSIIVFLFHEYFYPPPENHPMFGQGVGQSWDLANQEFYIEGVKIDITQYVLGFFLATSNMRNHPRIAKLILLFPWLIGIFRTILVMFGYGQH